MLLLKQGAVGPNVKAWQTRVGVKADGQFGAKTHQATVELQSLLGAIRRDGVVDEFVWHTAGLSLWSQRETLNTSQPLNKPGVSPARQSTMLELLGDPAPVMNEQCQPVRGPYYRQLVYSVNVGPFVVSGHTKAVQSLKKVLEDVRVEAPDLYRRLGTAGMLCARAVRGSSRSWSNHSWGTAIDILIDGQLDVLGDGSAQLGLFALGRFFNRHGWYWGAEFSREDSMHFEASEQLIREWFGR